MAATVQINTPPAKPTINSITVNAGQGEFIADTYRFMLVCEYNGLWWNSGEGQSSRYDPTAALSEASDIEEKIIGENDSITVDFSIGDADHWYMVYYRVSEPTNNWVLMDAAPRTDPSPYTYSKPFHPWYNYFYAPIFYYPDTILGLPVNKGSIGIHITGSGDVTIEEINDAIRSSGAVLGEHWMDGKSEALIVNGGIAFAEDYGAGTLDFTGRTIFTTGTQKWHGITLFAGKQSGQTGSRLMALSPNLAPYPNEVHNADIQQAWIGSPYYGNNQRINARPFINVYSGEVKHSFWDASVYGFTLIGIGEGCIVNYSGWWMEGSKTGVTFHVQNVRALGGDGLFTDCKIICDTESYLFLAYGSQGGDYVNEFRDSVIAFETDWIYGATYEFVAGEAVNPSFFFEDYIGCYAYANSGDRPKFKFTSSLNLTIVDGDGNPVVGAAVTAVGSADGVYHVDGTTDENGQISGVIPFYQVNILDHPTAYTRNMDVGTEIEFVRNTSYTLTISKSGYQTLQYDVQLGDTGQKLDGTIQLLGNVPPEYVDRSLTAEIASTAILGIIDSVSLIGQITFAEVEGVLTEEEVTGEPDEEEI